MYSPRAFFLSLSCASLLLQLSVQSTEVPAPVLVKNINASTQLPGLAPWHLTDAGGTTFFTGSDVEHGRELWKTDGTESGTVLVKDIVPGPASPETGSLVASGTKVFFSAYDGVHGWEIWSSDGTENGTRMVADLSPQPGVSSSPRMITPFKNGVVFVAEANATEVSLWFTDGTENGTRRLSAMPGYGLPEIIAIDGPFIAIGGLLYFSLWDSVHGHELWKSNGTPEGTLLVKDIVPGAEGPSPAYLTAVGNTLYFSATTTAQGNELWKSNGTAAGTVLVKDIQPGPAHSYPVPLGGSGNSLFMIVDNQELWTSTGTAGSTVRVQTLVADGSSLEQAMVVGNRVLCLIYKPSSKFQFVSVDPKLKTAEVMMELSWDQGSGWVGVDPLVSQGNRAAFVTATHSANSLLYTLWSWDGLTAPQPLYEGPDRVQTPLVTSTGRLFFSGPDQGLWKSEGTPEGTALVKNVFGTEPGSAPRSLKTLAGRVYFSASGELWSSDGTEAGTVQIAPGLSFSAFTILAELNGQVFFTGDDGVHGNELWKTDGTEAGTVMVKDIRPGSGSSSIFSATAYTGHLYFSATGPNNDAELWRSDGTEAGTILFADLNTSAVFSSSRPGHFTVMNGSLYLTATNEYLSSYLWRTQGVPGDITRVTSAFRIVTPPVLRPPTPGAALLPDQALLFFFARDNENRYGLCRSDGTAEGSVMIQALAENGVTAEARSLTVFGNRLFFRLHDDQGTKLYSSNGVTTAPVNTPVRLDIISSQSLVSDLWVAGNKIYFRGSIPGVAGSHGIWCTDQNASAPVQVYSDITAGAPGIISNQGDRLFFSTYQFNLGSKLWVTQGETANTRELPGVLPGGDSTFATLGSRVLFPAFSSFYGEELHALEPVPGIRVSDVSQGENGAPIALPSGNVLDFGYRFVSLSMAPAYLRLTNVGFGDLTGLTATLEGPDAGDFAVSPASLPSTVGSGKGTTLEVSFSPQASGPRTATLRVTSGGATPLTYTLTLTGHGIQSGSAPVVTQDPGSFLVVAGSHVTLTSDAALMPPATHTWLRNGTSVQTSTVNPFLTIPFVQTTHVGAYTYNVSTAQGDATTGPGYVGVVIPAPATVSSQQYKLLTLTCTATAPTGTTLSYQWLRDNAPLADIDRTRGSHSATLTIASCVEADLGVFECIVTLTTSGQGPNPAPSVSHGITQVILTDRPRLPLDFTLPDVVVGHEVDLQVLSTYIATAFTAKGLPPGISLSSSGRLTGRPAKMKGVSKTGAPLPYLVTFTSSNALGSSNTITVPWVILAPLPVGSFDGLLDRLPGGQDLGGRVTLTTLAAGTLTGQLTLEGKVYRFTKILSSVVPTPPEDETAAYKMVTTVEIPRGRGLTPWSLEIQVYEELSLLDLRLTAGANTIEGSLYPRVFSTTTPATGHTGPYTLSLSAETPGTDIPVGNGWITATVGKSGTYTWTGRLADDTAITGSGFLTESIGTVRMMVHAPLYKNTGSLHGQIFLHYFPTVEVPHTSATGLLSWLKRAAPASSKERIYKDGIPLHDLTVEGGLYTQPPRDRTLFSTYFYDSFEEGFLGDIHVGISGAGLEPLVRDLLVNTRHVVYLPPVADRAPLKNLSFNVAKGTFTGQLSFSDPNPVIPARPYVRNTKFQGVVLPIQRRGAGYFMLNQLPVSEPVSTTLTTSPILSGEVKLTPFPQQLP